MSQLPERLRYPALFHDGQAYILERADEHTGSYFGGPFERPVTGVKHSPRSLHHIASLNGHCFEPLWHVIGGGNLHLLYGMCYDGCHLKYRISVAGVEVLEMKPTTSAEDWPYSDYPAYLSYFPLRLQQRSQCRMEEFLDLACQPIDVSTSEVLVLVPPSPVLGMSLWGPSGDAENTQIVFRCDLAKRTVEAYNQCG
jgi:hypothetical protein